jgi:SAM-dependent methyltransferase
MKLTMHQKLPSEWVEREKLRDKGQFWTPSWVADAMVAYVSQNADLIFDPGVGKGIFYSALKKQSKKKKFYGLDIDPAIIKEARNEGVFDSDCKIEIRDFILNPPIKRFKAIVANPPYIRHHRISREMKDKFRSISYQAIGDALDGRAGLHVYFLIQALNLLDTDGRLAFIMPADTCEGVFSHKLWKWITRKYCLEGVVTFDYKASPFPGVDTNAVIFLIRNQQQKNTIKWIKCLVQGTHKLEELLHNNLGVMNTPDLIIKDRRLDEALAIGLSREPRTNHKFQYTLSNFARVMRGIATGDNEFFFLTEKQAWERNIPSKFLRPAIGRTRDVEGSYVTEETISSLKEKGRPTLLFFPNGELFPNMPRAVQNYIHEGEKRGLPKRALISTRQPWYKMEVREIPPFLFAYLGRRNARFIKNEAGVIPLTGFLCVYPRSNDKEYLQSLWHVLQAPETVANLQLVGKSYGAGAVKVEPRSLERLPIDAKLVEETGLKPVNKEPLLFD